MRRVFMGAIGLALCGPAWATTGLVWQFPEAGLRYAVSTRVRLGQVMVLMAENNREVRIGEFQVDLVLTCVSTPFNKSAWELRCDVDDASFGAVPVQTDDKWLVPVLDEMDANLTNAWVQVQFTHDGRAKSIDLEEYPKNNTRTAAIEETVRLVVIRAIAGLDLELPAKGDDKDRGAWRTDDMLATAHPASTGTLGTVAAVHAVRGVSDGIASIESVGEGVLHSSETGPTGEPKFSWSTRYVGEMTFDTRNGWLVERQFIVEGVPTSSSAAAIDAVKYAQLLRVWRVVGDPPTLLESRAMAVYDFPQLQ